MYDNTPTTKTDTLKRFDELDQQNDGALDGRGQNDGILTSSNLGTDYDNIDRSDLADRLLLEYVAPTGSQGITRSDFEAILDELSPDEEITSKEAYPGPYVSGE